MKSFYHVFCFCLFLFSSAFCYSQDANLHIYLAFGQSNMEGVGDIANQDKNTDSRFQALESYDCQSNLGRGYGEWYTATPPLFGCWGKLSIADSFGREMIKALPNHIQIAIVPTAVGGSDIALFQKGAPIGVGQYGKDKVPPQFPGGYDWLLDLSKKAQQKGVIKGIIFHQGETNTGQQDWKNKVAEIVGDLKKDLELGDIPFLAGELLHGGCCDSHNAEIAKLPSVLANAHVISASGLGGVDVAHFSSESYRTFGRRYAEKMLELVNVTTDLGCGAMDNKPICCQTSSDPDGDGWGEESGTACLIVESGSSSSSSSSTSSSSSSTSSSSSSGGGESTAGSIGLLTLMVFAFFGIVNKKVLMR